MLKQIKLSLLSVLMICSGHALASSVIPKVSVLVEKDDQYNRACQFSYISAEAAAKAALRYNRIEIVNTPSTDSMWVYVGSGSFHELGARDLCAVMLKVEFYHFQSVKIPATELDIVSRVVHCANGTGGTIHKRNIQTELNAMVREVIDSCINEIEKKAKK